MLPWASWHANPPTQRARIWRGSSAANSSRLRPSHASTSTTPSTILYERSADITRKCHHTRAHPQAASRTACLRWVWKTITRRRAAVGAWSCRRWPAVLCCMVFGLRRKIPVTIRSRRPIRRMSTSSGAQEGKTLIPLARTVSLTSLVDLRPPFPSRLLFGFAFWGSVLTRISCCWARLRTRCSNICFLDRFSSVACRRWLARLDSFLYGILVNCISLLGSHRMPCWSGVAC